MAAEDKYTAVFAVYPTVGGAMSNAYTFDPPVKVYAATAIQKDENGEVKADDTGRLMPGSGTMWGVLLGGLTAVLLPGVGLAAGALVGGAAGLTQGLFNERGFGKDTIKKAEADLKPGTSALMALVPPEDVSQFEKIAKSQGAEFYSFQYTKEQIEAAAKAAIADAATTPQ